MNDHRKTTLDGEWTLSWLDHETYLREGAGGNVKTCKAEVPGNFEQDLYKAGIIGDPYFGMNTLALQELECMHMFYQREFEFDGNLENAYLRFEGIDNYADIYVNGKLIASVADMLTAHEFKGANLRNGRNEITVHIKPANIEARKYPVAPVSRAMKYNAAGLYTRKAPHMYGWDIMPRIVSGGIWRSVCIEEKPSDRIENVFIWTDRVDLENKYGHLNVCCDLASDRNSLRGMKLIVRGVCGESGFYGEHELWHTSESFGVDVRNCKFWFPRNYGEPNLYAATVELVLGDTVLDAYKLNVGVRTVGLDRTSTTDAEGSGEFCIRVNGQKIFAMGSNWVPVDAFHSNDAGRLPRIMPMLTDIGCNIVRCWGGNVYENELFYDFCDSNGIMIWQDFAMACATYPQDELFQEILRPEIHSVILKYRNHPSLTIWAGDNECDSCGCLADPNDNIITRRTIPEQLRLYDFTRPYLPSSPYMDETAVKTRKPTSEEHCWGPRDYFKGDYYRNTVCHFASETGYHGCPSPESLARFISPEKLWPPENNLEWVVHAAAMTASFDDPYAYRIPLMTRQVVTLFGHEPDNLEDYSLASQISQAEAKKYFIERFRVTKWRRTGIIWWNLIDGWPQISDAVVDYYLDKKLAYYYIKRSQQPLCFIFDEPDKNNTLPLHVVSDLQRDVRVSYRVTDITEGKTLLESEVTAPANSSVCVWRKELLPNERHFYLMEWEYDGVKGKNHYMTNIIDIDFDSYVKNAKKCGFELRR